VTWVEAEPIDSAEQLGQIPADPEQQARDILTLKRLRNPAHDELRAMRKISELLEPFEGSEKRRILKWLVDFTLGEEIRLPYSPG
jgi:hypothetical protein